MKCQYRTPDQQCNFRNLRWRTAAILKIALSPYLSRELTDFDQIWYTGANFHSEHGNLTKNRHFSNSRWRTDAILKIVFWLYLGAVLADLCKFRNGDEELHADIGDLTKTAISANSRWRTAAILKIAFDQIWFLRCKFPFRGWLFDKNRNFSNSRSRTDAILKIDFWLYLGTLLAD